MPCLATSSAPDQQTHDITIEDYFTLATASEGAVSPDAWYKSR